MKIAIMQPYFFPYFGYWQLISAVDRFVIYDDVNYIKGGWINRNRILINGKPNYINAPLQHASPYRKINEIDLQQSIFWRKKLKKKISLTYKNSPFYKKIFPIIDRIIQYETTNLADYLASQVIILSKLMGIKTEIVLTSSHYKNSQLAGQARVIDMCRIEGATTYINLSGGKTIYDPTSFHEAGVNLRYIKMKKFVYRQDSAVFIPNLSIIDVLMNLGVSGAKQFLDEYTMIDFGKNDLI